MTESGPATPQQLADLYDAGTLFEKGRQLQANGKAAQAEPLLKQAIEKQTNATSADNPQVGLYMTELAGCLSALSRHSEADDLVQKALAIVEKAYYADHAHVATVLDRQAMILLAQNKLSEAEPVAKRVLEIDGKTLSGEHRHTLEATRRLANIYMRQEKWADAEQLLTKAMKNVETPLGPAGYFQYDLARCLKAQGKTAEAEKAFKLAASWLEQRVRYMVAADCLDDYAQLLKETGRAPEAQKLEARAKIFRSYGADKWEEAAELPSTLLRA